MKTLLAIALLALSFSAPAQVAPPLADVLDVDATVSTEVAPDLSVVTLAVVREGADVAPLTKDVNQVLAKAFADAKAVPAVVAANGGYSTYPRYDNRNGQSVRNGWTVRAEIVLKSKDFEALGGLVGRLAQTMQITGTSFELSPELRAQEGAALIDRGAKAFREKAAAATRAFGFTDYAIRQVSLGNASQSGGVRPMMMAKQADAMPIEAGRVTLSVTVNGSVQMRR